MNGTTRVPLPRRVARLDGLIETARKRASRRRVAYGALALSALAVGLFFLISRPPGAGNGHGGLPGSRGSAEAGAHERFAPGPVRFLRSVRLPPSSAPPFVRQAFKARRYSASAPRVAGRFRGARGPSVLWVSWAYGGGWCQALQQPRIRFDRGSVSCIWPQAWMRHRIAFSGYLPSLFFGRVPQRSAVTLRLRLSDGRNLRVPTRSGFFLVRIPDRILAHAGPRALLAYDGRGRLVARDRSLGMPPPFLSTIEVAGGGRPPYSAELAHRRKLIAADTPTGHAVIWAAPSSVAPARCTWLQIGRAVEGGGCRRFQPSLHGLSRVAPLRFRLHGKAFSLLWGHVGADVARLAVRFQDGAETRLPLARGVFLYSVPASRWIVGHRPAFVVAQDSKGRTIARRLLFEYTLAPVRADRR